MGGIRRRAAAVAALVALTLVLVTTLASWPDPAGATLAPRPFAQVDMGTGNAQYACGRATDSSLWCWGKSWNGQFGNGSVGSVSGVPVRVTTAGTPLAGKAIAEVRTGGAYACARTTEGAVACWGPDAADFNGGTGTAYVPRAVQVSGTALAGKQVAHIESGLATFCAIATDATLACWGANIAGETGVKSDAPWVDKPTAVFRGTGSALAGQTVTQVSVGNHSSCAVTAGGKVACWGTGGLGTDAVGASTYPVAVKTAGTALAGKTFTQVSVSQEDSTACAVTTDGLVGCWGLGTSGQLGNGAKSSSTLPVLVKASGTILAGRKVKQVAVGTMSHVCAVTTDGLVACWGSNSHGQIGVSTTTTSSATPVSVQRSGTALAGVTVTQIAAGHGSCARGSDGRLACWGPTWYGVLGNGDTSAFGRQPAPVGVIGSGPFWAYPGTAALVDQVFRDVVDRSPTSSERSTWVARIDGKSHTPGAMVAALRGSTDNVQHVDPVARLFWAYFDRSPDPAGFDYWVGRKRSGTSLGTVSQAFAGSTEFQNTYGDLTNRQFVELVYQNVLGRPGDAAGVAYWTAQLDQHKRTRGQVMVGFSESGEYAKKVATRVTAGVVYWALLERGPTALELAGVVNRLGAGGSIAVEAQYVLDSTEYTRRVIAL